MTDKKDEALKLALEAFEADASNENFLILKHRVREALAEQPAQKTCLVANESCKHGSWCSEVYCQEHCKFAQPAQEPVAWLSEGGDVSRSKLYMDEMGFKCEPLYKSPPQRKPLTDEEIWDEVKAADLDWQTGWSLDEDASNRYITFARAIEAAHGIKEKRND